MTTTFYIFHGDDDLSIEEAVNKLRSEMGSDSNADLNITDIDGTNASVPEIINTVSSYPFLADRRLVIVKGLIGWITRRGAGNVGKEAVKRLEEDLPNLPPTARLVLVERESLSNKNTVLKFASELDNGFIRAFEAPKDTTSWIIKRSKQAYGIRIDNRAAMALAAVTGSDLRRADNELVKLASYVAADTSDEGRQINEDDVATMTPYVPEASIFKMVDAVSEGRGQVALELMHRLMMDKKQDSFSIFGMIVRQFRLLLIAKEHGLRGGASGDLAKVAGVAGFVAQNLQRQSRDFGLDDLERIYHNLAETDLKMKTGQIDPELALDLFITSVAR